MTTIIFVRHAQSLHPWSDDRTRPLTEEGLRDRGIVLDTLRNEKYEIDAFLCSPYRRSADTIRPAAEAYGMEIITDERFRERTGGAGSAGMLEKRWADLTFAEEGGESILSVQQRNMEAFREVLRGYAGRTVVIGTHGTALSSILRYYDPSFGVKDFLRIIDWMPCIIEMTFSGDKLLGKRELAHVKKDWQPADPSVITACGETCTGCEKYRDGRCPGCIAADGIVPEWKESGRCRVHACAHDHGVTCCALCAAFPCERVPVLIHWKPDAVEKLAFLRNELLKSPLR
ncbi:MAG: hypothetical protein CW338_12195 [Clostridiales bacterium]|nr:hypothetical protein [Clostridiales bacterium]